MEGRLKVAAEAGDIDTLYTLLPVDPYLLENIDQSPFSQTPLHVAALAGQTSFVLEILNLKPSLIRKLNTDGYSPLHIASIEGQVEMVRELLEFDQELGLLKGREWRTPLHCAVISGKLEIIDELLSTSTCTSEWLKAMTVRQETALHLALKFGQIGVFERLLEGVKAKNAEEIMNWKDREGNTILHLAAYHKQFQIIDVLLQSKDFLNVADIDTKNKSGLTALDVLRQHSINESTNMEIKSVLMRVGAVSAQDTAVSITAPFPLNSTASMEPMIILEELLKGLPMEKWAKELESSPSETRSALMVVAVLIATVTFQVALSPPGGFTERCYRYTYLMQSALHDGYTLFLVLLTVMNSIGFMTSIAMITVLTRRSPLKALLRMAVLSMVTSYLCLVAFIDSGDPIIVTLVALLVITILLLQWIHLKMRSLKKVFYG